MSTHIVPVIRIEEILPHPNADRLELVPVKGWNCAVKKGNFKVGDLAVYIEPDFMVPVTRPEFAFLKDPGKFDQTHARIRAMRLRGHMSFGLLIPAPIEGMVDTDTNQWRRVQPGDNMIHALGVHRWEPPEVQSMRQGFRMTNDAVPSFIRDIGKFDLENLNNYLDVIVPGETVVITEKIRGSNARYCFHAGEFYVGSRSQWLRRPTEEEADKGHKLDAWHKVADSDPTIRAWCEANPDKILYGEIFGSVQDLKYGRPNSVDFAAFAAIDIHTREWVPTMFLLAQCYNASLRTVPLLGVEHFNRTDIDTILECDSYVGGAPEGHMREGIVITPLAERRDPRIGRVSLKLISNRYWTRKF